MKLKISQETYLERQLGRARFGILGRMLAIVFGHVALSQIKRTGEARCELAIRRSGGWLLLVGGSEVDDQIVACSPAADDTSGPKTKAVCPDVTVTKSGKSPSENVSITDRDGNTFDVAVGYSMTSVTNDPSAEKPGFTSALLNVAIDLTLKNTTASRDISFANENGTVAPLSYPSLTLVAVYAADSAVCAAQYPGQFCAFSPGFGRWNSTLPQSGTLPVQVYAGLRNGTGAAGVAQIPEAQFADVQAALATPGGYLITYRGGDNQRFTSVCPSETSPWGVAIAAIGNACIGSITLQQPTGG